jgi:hypothetical protein
MVCGILFFFWPAALAAIAAPTELPEIRAFGNVVRQNHCFRRIVPKNRSSRRAFEFVAETCIGALAEPDQFPAPRRGRAQNRRRNGFKLEWFGARPFLDQMFEDRGPAP